MPPELADPNRTARLADARPADQRKEARARTHAQVAPALAHAHLLAPALHDQSAGNGHSSYTRTTCCAVIAWSIVNVEIAKQLQ